MSPKGTGLCLRKGGIIFLTIDFYLQAHVDGYARLFGIFREVHMLVTSDSLQIYLTTDVNKSFKIDVHVITNYSSNRNETQFNAMVVFDNGLSKVRKKEMFKRDKKR